jgi:hypothetical protein
MGTMSASDAAPLPRLGEVFFDVRGDSRTMRVSWYSGTGIAVFSIWQGDTCTGTFRLPIPELPRMVEALAKGPPGAVPGGYRDGPDVGYPGPAPGEYGDSAPGGGSPGGYWDVPPGEYGDSAPGGGSPGGYWDVPPEGGHGAPGAGYPDPPAAPAPFARHREASYPPTGPLPVGRWHAREPSGEYPQPWPADEFPDDPLGGDYHDEAEQGYLPSPPTDMFPAAPMGGDYLGRGPGEPPEREYGHPHGRS